MRDALLAFACQDGQFAWGVGDALATRGLTIGSPVSLWPGMRLLPLVDQGLVDNRHALVVISRDFLAFPYQPKELDGLANRRRVFPVLYGVDEAEMAELSTRLAVAAIAGAMAEQLVRLLRA